MFSNCIPDLCSNLVPPSGTHLALLVLQSRLVAIKADDHCWKGISCCLSKCWMVISKVIPSMDIASFNECESSERSRCCSNERTVSLDASRHQERTHGLRTIKWWKVDMPRLTSTCSNDHRSLKTLCFLLRAVRRRGAGSASSAFAPAGAGPLGLEEPMARSWGACIGRSALLVPFCLLTAPLGVIVAGWPPASLFMSRTFCRPRTKSQWRDLSSCSRLGSSLGPQRSRVSPQ